MRCRYRKATKLKRTFIIVPPSSHEVQDQRRISNRCILPSISL